MPNGCCRGTHGVQKCHQSVVTWNTPRHTWVLVMQNQTAYTRALVGCPNGMLQGTVLPKEW
jgi:hypothetical protein